MAMRETKRELLLHFSAETCSECGRKEQIQKWWIFRDRMCNFSLRSQAIGPSDFDGARRKAVLCGEDCEAPRKSNFLKEGKIVISVKIRNFSRSQMTKRTSPLESSREI